MKHEAARAVIPREPGDVPALRSSGCSRPQTMLGVGIKPNSRASLTVGLL